MSKLNQIEYDERRKQLLYNIRIGIGNKSLVIAYIPESDILVFEDFNGNRFAFIKQEVEHE